VDGWKRKYSCCGSFASTDIGPPADDHPATPRAAAAAQPEIGAAPPRPSREPPASPSRSGGRDRSPSTRHALGRRRRWELGRSRAANRARGSIPRPDHAGKELPHAVGHLDLPRLRAGPRGAGAGRCVCQPFLIGCPLSCRTYTTAGDMALGVAAALKPVRVFCVHLRFDLLPSFSTSRARRCTQNGPSRRVRSGSFSYPSPRFC
jgi:hypothetical protein